MTEASISMREYETIYVLKPDLEDNKVVEVEERMRSVVEQTGGKSIKIHNWGKKKLAFEVDKVQKGIFVHHLYLGGPKLVAEYERTLKILDDALIYQTMRLKDNVDPASRAVEEDVLIPPVRELTKRDRDRDGYSASGGMSDHGDDSDDVIPHHHDSRHRDHDDARSSDLHDSDSGTED